MVTLSAIHLRLICILISHGWFTTHAHVHTLMPTSLMANYMASVGDYPVSKWEIPLLGLLKSGLVTQKVGFPTFGFRTGPACRSLADVCMFSSVTQESSVLNFPVSYRYLNFF